MSRGVDNRKGEVGHVWRAKRAEKFLGLINIHNRRGFR